MTRKFEVLLCLAGALALSFGIYADKGSSDSIQSAVKEARENCLLRRSTECAYLEFFTILDLVIPSGGSQRLSRGNTSAPDLLDQVPNSAKRHSEVSVQMVNHLLADRMFRQLRANALWNSSLEKFLSVMDVQTTDSNQEVQRGMKLYWWKYVGSFLLTISLVLFSALVSKALTLSTISVMLSLLGLLGGLGGTGGGGGGHGHTSVPIPAYHSPATIVAPAVQYVDEPDEQENPYVYINRMGWKSARSGNYDNLFKSQ